ncbi:hypothetical protein AOL_s00215g754 [Orbilia oligospora ATCC 24927]|uniref:Uncharacterized protein n=1 Tax=Arthrobotrys oligospora (strain ATCC 24927 / CBS 115.81 / DSM 1491) TaxID=756982 RepID=G1XUU6_ARTOA|nr:hypothetical protein AOL_s00215g754 [Orbilia oligospora ATCC 24927]EGX43145.1 hypothetical protein AOL_s00215g754 [Orbilia oligospora ATCC 24927]
MPDVEAHIDSSSLRPYVKPIKELPDPTISSPNVPINISRSNPTSTPTSATEMENPDMRESLHPFDPTTEGVTTTGLENARKTLIGLSLGIIIILILLGAVTGLMVMKHRRARAKDLEAAAEAAIAASENGGKSDPDVVSPAPPRYSLEDPAAVGVVALPPGYLEARKSDEKREQSSENSTVEEEKTDTKVKKNGSLRSSPVRNMRILV